MTMARRSPSPFTGKRTAERIARSETAPGVGATMTGRSSPSRRAAKRQDLAGVSAAESGEDGAATGASDGAVVAGGVLAASPWTAVERVADMDFLNMSIPVNKNSEITVLCRWGFREENAMVKND